jgi:hypothetical protein
MIETMTRNLKRIRIGRGRSSLGPIAFLWSFALASIAYADTTKPENTSKPNILLIVADDLGYQDVGFQGCKDYQTPHIDSIAKKGVRCSNGYVSSPQCAPSRCGLLTGRYQNRFGYEYNHAHPNVGLPLSETTVASRLKQCGYATGLIGKWHLGETAELHPLSRGFDSFFGFLGGGFQFVPNPKDSSPLYKGSPLLRDRQVVPHTEYLTDMLGDESAAFVKSRRNEPWFLLLAFNAPPERSLYWRFNFPGNKPELYRWAVREGSMKWVHTPRRRDPGGFDGTSVERLVNLDKDIGESNDLQETQRDLARSMRERWTVWNDSMMTPFGDLPQSLRDGKKPGNRLEENQ